MQMENREMHRMRWNLLENNRAKMVMQQVTRPKIDRKQPRNKGTLFSVRMTR